MIEITVNIPILIIYAIWAIVSVLVILANNQQTDGRTFQLMFGSLQAKPILTVIAVILCLFVGVFFIGEVIRREVENG